MHEFKVDHGVFEEHVGGRQVAVSSVVSCLLVLAACSSPRQPAAAAPAPAAPEPPAAGVVGSAIGRDLDAAEKEKAIAAQQEAVNSGSRKSWRGARNYGFVEPGPEGAAVSGACRDYSHKIFINGRPQQAKGQACKRPDGSWRVVN